MMVFLILHKNMSVLVDLQSVYSLQTDYWYVKNNCWVYNYMVCKGKLYCALILDLIAIN